MNNLTQSCNPAIKYAVSTPKQEDDMRALRDIFPSKKAASIGAAATLALGGLLPSFAHAKTNPSNDLKPGATREATLRDIIPGLDYDRDIYVEAGKISKKTVMIQGQEAPVMGLWIALGEADARAYAKKYGLEFTPETAPEIFDGLGQKVTEFFATRWGKFGITLESSYKPSDELGGGSAVGVWINGWAEFHGSAQDLIARESEISQRYHHIWDILPYLKADEGGVKLTDASP